MEQKSEKPVVRCELITTVCPNCDPKAEFDYSTNKRIICEKCCEMFYLIKCPVCKNNEIHKYEAFKHLNCQKHKFAPICTGECCGQLLVLAGKRKNTTFHCDCSRTFHFSECPRCVCTYEYQGPRRGTLHQCGSCQTHSLEVKCPTCLLWNIYHEIIKKDLGQNCSSGWKCKQLGCLSNLFFSQCPHCQGYNATQGMLKYSIVPCDCGKKYQIIHCMNCHAGVTMEDNKEEIQTKCPFCSVKMNIGEKNYSKPNTRTIKYEVDVTS